MELQRTIDGFGLPTLVRAGNHPDDMVETEDNGLQRRADCTEDGNGALWHDNSELEACESCGDLFHIDELSENDDCCEECYNETHPMCTHCGGRYHEDDMTTCDDGDDYCRDCYNNNFDHCANCGQEHYTYGCCSDYTFVDEEVYCNSCAPDCDCNPDYNWKNYGGFHLTKSERRYGVELECSSAEGYGAWIKDSKWGAKDDGSVPGGKEFISPPMAGDDGMRSIAEVCRNLNSDYAEVDNSCGFHLHIDLSDTTKEERKNIALAYYYTCEFWHSCIDESRYDIEYSRLHENSRRNYAYDCRGDAGRTYWTRSDIVNGDDKPDASTRYVWCNWNSFDRHQTVEIRMHHATTDGAAVQNWVKAHIRFVDYVRNLSTAKITRIFGRKGRLELLRVFREIWADSELSDYYGPMIAERDSASQPV